MKKIKSNTLIVLFCFANLTSLFSQAPTFSWAQHIAGTNNDVGKAIAVDATGNIYSIGEFRGTADFDPSAVTNTLASNGSSDVYILKQDANGNTLWAKKFGSTSADYAGGVAIDNSGNVIVTGSFAGTVDFDPSAAIFNITSAGSTDICVLKLDANGNFIWARAMGGTSTDYGLSVTVTSVGDVYTTGQFNGTADFDPSILNFNLTAVSATDIFVSKLDAFGGFIWAKGFGGTGTDYSAAIATNSTGVFVTGYFQGTVDFDPSSSTSNLTSNGSNDAFICTLNNSGNFVWAINIGGTGADVGQGIDLDASGNVLVTGSFNGTADFNPTASTFTLLSMGSVDAYVAKYSQSGTLIWAKSFGASFADNGYGISTDSQNNIYTTGIFRGTVDFDPGAATFTVSSNTSSDDVYIQCLDASGNFKWVKAFGNLNDEQAAGISTNNNIDICVVGNFNGTVDFNPDGGINNLTSNLGDDAFTHKMNICLPPMPPTNTTSNINLTICNGQFASLTASGGGTLTWYPTSTSSTSLATGPIYNTPTLTTGNYSYFVEASTCTTSATRTQITVTVSSCTGLNENSNFLSMVKTYPNPSSGLYTIDAPYQMQISVINVLGKKILEQTIFEGKNQIDLSNYVSGIYFLSVKGKAKESVIKLIKD
ncbi:MAG: T9SS type A sorting domain-containing protein [Bacteroidota bacterium]|nr:T9SS type A sorting domain-containing protein [Bacteroidota bacterium]